MNFVANRRRIIVVMLPLRFAALLLALPSCAAASQQTQPRSLPDPDKLMLQVENQEAFDDARRDYTYKIKVVNQERNKDGSAKKTTTTDAESFTVQGIRINRITAKDGKPLSDNEKRKQEESIDKLVARQKEHRSKLQTQGKPTNAQGEEVLTVRRILELGTFSNLHEGTYAGRPVWIIDYAGNPQAATRNEFEKVVRDLYGTVWIDQADNAMVASHGEFRKDFKIGGGLLAKISAHSYFDFRAIKVDDAAWLPQSIDAEGSMRYLLFGGFNGTIHIETSEYRKFRTTMRIVGVGDQAAPSDSSPTEPAPSQPQP